VDAVFDDVSGFAADCRFGNCRHLSEPGCAVLLAASEGRLPADRLESFRKLQRELDALAGRRDEWSRQATKARVKSIHKLAKRFKPRDF
jgi:ribosome biogenesis GTPase